MKPVTKSRMKGLQRADREREHDEPAGDGELRGLDKNDPEVEPGARPVDLRAEEGREDEQARRDQVERDAEIADPLVVDETRGKKEAEPEEHPVDLLAPLRGKPFLLTHPAGAVDREDSENRQADDIGEEQPIHSQKFAEERGHDWISDSGRGGDESASVIVGGTAHEGRCRSRRSSVCALQPK